MSTHDNINTPANELDDVFKIIIELGQKSVQGNYIYRGETQGHEKVSSSLYREYTGREAPDMAVLQQTDVDEARRYTHETDEFAILTELQHYGGKTNLIDFTADYLIALFFACDGSHSQNGRVILLERSHDINEYVYGPTNPVTRVLAQKSVFVKPPEGYVEPTEVVDIPHELKLPMLDYLQKSHGISAETIYNDLHGFIRSRAIHREAFEHLNTAVVHQRSRESQRTIDSCTKALDLNPRMLRALQIRGETYSVTLEYGRAIADFDRMIEINPSSVNAHMNRGLALHHQGDYDAAILEFDTVAELQPQHTRVYHALGNSYSAKKESDPAILAFNQAIAIDPENAHSHNGLGIVYFHERDFHQAIEHFEKMIALAPKEPHGYMNLGESWLHLADWGKAKANLLAAQSMGGDLIKSFLNDYESIDDFEQKNDINIPQDIVELLTKSKPRIVVR